MSPLKLPLDRLIRKEVALGTIREIVPPTQHIGTQLVPWLEVGSDEVIFDYAKGLTDGLAPARADDAESELAQKDDSYLTQGRASLIDWSLKDHYTASDVERYREALLVAEQTRDTLSLPLTIGNVKDGFANRLARDTALRRRKLDNRIEWMIMTAIDAGAFSYNDGKIKFTATYGRPGGQTDQTLTNAWGTPDSDPIGDIVAVQESMYDTYGVRMTRALVSRKTLNKLMASEKFIARSGLISAPTPTGAAPGTTVDPRYVLDGWGPVAAQRVVEAQTGITFIEYDAVYRTRPIGSNTTTATRFTRENNVIFLPDEADIAEFDGTELGFGKLLTSPHPAGDWTPGFYAWEHDYGQDPWGHDIGTGVKAFPVFPHMDLTYNFLAW